MCHQFQIPTLSEIKKYLINDLKLPLVEPTTSLPENINVFPKNQVPVLLYQNEQLLLKSKSWGYPSPFNHQKVVFNARIEHFFEKKPSMWDQSFAKSRCLIITKQFFESSRQTYTASNGHRYHENFGFLNPNEPLTMIAGIYHDDHFSMVTTKPNSIMAPIHNRMPLIIQSSELRQWLFQNFTSLIDRHEIDLVVRQTPHDMR